MQGNPGNLCTWWWGQCHKCKKVTNAEHWTHREMWQMWVCGIWYAGNHSEKCSQFSCMGSIGYMALHHHVLILASFSCVGSIPSMGDLFALMALSPVSPVPCTYIPAFPYVGFNSLNRSLIGSHPNHVSTFPAFPCVISHHYHAHGFNSLCGWPFCTLTLSPSPCTYIPCISLHFFRHGSPPLPCRSTYIPYVPRMVPCIHCVPSNQLGVILT